MQPGHKGPQKSVHYSGFAFAKKGGNNQQNTNNNPPPPSNTGFTRPTSYSITPKNQAPHNAHNPQFSQTYQPNKGNPMLQQNNSPFPTNNNNNFGGMNRNNPNMNNMPRQSSGSVMNVGMQRQPQLQQRNTVPPNMQQAAMMQMQQSMSMRGNMNPQRAPMSPPMNMSNMRNNPSMRNMGNMANMNNNRPPNMQQNMNPNMRQSMPPQNNKGPGMGLMPNTNPQPMRQSMPPQNNKGLIPQNNNNNMKPPNARIHHTDSMDSQDDDIYGKYTQNKKSQPSQPGAANNNNLKPNNQRNQHFNKTASTGNLMPTNPQQNHFKNTASTGALKVNVTGPKHRKEKTKIFGADPSVPAPPKGPGGVVKPRNIPPSQVSPQQLQQMNAINKSQMMRQQMLRQQQSARNVNGHQRQVQRNYPQGAWGPNHPWFKYYQRMAAMRGRQGGAAAMNNPHYRQWQQYYQRMMQNPQGQLQQMVMQQQQMIGNLKRQLQERDKHYHKTIQTTINFKDMEINDLREQISKLDAENEAIGELQMQNFKMKQELNALRGDHQSNVFDNLLSNMTAKSVNQAKVGWPGGVPPPPGAADKGNKYPSPPESSTKAAGAVDPKAAINAMLRAKASPSEMLLTKKKDATEKKLDNKDDGKYAKYARMKKIGMPMVSIVNRMRMDGMSAKEIEEYTGEKVGGDKEEEKPKGPKINLADAKFAKYKRMQKLKMPMKTIVNRMKLDGCSQAEMDAFSGKESSTESSAAKKKKSQLEAMRQLAKTMGLNPISEALPSKVTKMKRLHWDIVELSALRKTFWWDINQNSAFPEHIDLGGKFELDFQVRARKPRLQTGKGKISGGLDVLNRNKRAKTVTDKVRWIGAKRDQAIQIALKRIGLPNEVIYDAIVDVDEEVMTLDLLEVVWEIVPTTDEQALAETKVDEIGDNMENVGISEMFHIEMSTIPEVKQQLSKWLFARTFREIYMERLQQVSTMQKCANSIRNSVPLQTYFRIILSMGNLMNHGTLKGLAYGFKLDSVVKLLAGVKDYGGQKDLAMFLYQFAYNKFPESRSILKDLQDPLKSAKRLEISTIEQSIVKMADEFTAIDLFLRRLQDDFHPGDTERFREYMSEFQEKQASDMMNLKVKIQNATQICKRVAKFYSIELEDGKPEYLFVIIQQFLDILDSAKRTLLKLEKERIKQEKRAAAQRAKEERKKNRKAGMSVADRIADKKKRHYEEEEKGNLLFLDIKNAANQFAQRQEQMKSKLEATLKEKKQLAEGKISASAQKDAIKRRVSAQVMDGGNDSVGGLDMDEIKRLRAMNLGPGGGNNGPMGNSLLVPGMEAMGPPPGMEMDDDQKLPPMMENDEEFAANMNSGDYGMLAPMGQAQDGKNVMDMPPMGQDGNIQINFGGQQMPMMTEEMEDMNQDIDVQPPGQNTQTQPQPTVDLNNAQWDDDDF